MSQSPPLPVGTTSLDLSDDTRRSWQGGGPRPLRSEVWYPATDGATETAQFAGSKHRPVFFAGHAAVDAVLRPGRYPLVLMSHGTGGLAKHLAWLGTALAQEGFICVAVNHHGNNALEPPDPRGFMLWWERARDLSRSADLLLADATFGPHLDKDSVAAVGFSLGAHTALLLAGARTDLAAFREFCAGPDADATCRDQVEFPGMREKFARLAEQDDAVQASLARSAESYRDTRVRAVVALAPAMGSALTEESVVPVQLPVRIVVGAADKVAPVKTNAGRIARLLPNARLLVLPDLGHYTFLGVCTEFGHQKIPTFCDDPPGVDRSAVHQQVAAQTVRFLRKHLGVA